MFRQGVLGSLRAAVALVNGQGQQGVAKLVQQQSHGLRTCAAVHSSGVSADVLDAVKKGMDFVTNNAKVRKRKVLGKRGLKLQVVITTCP